MKRHLQHLEFSKLADLAENRLAPSEKGQSESHLAECPACSVMLQKLQRTIQLMITDDSKDAPRDVLLNAVNIFDRGRQLNSKSLLGRLVASLTFDSATTAPAFGMRSGQSTTRQLIYTAAEHDIDLRLKKQDNNWMVSGQLLSEHCAGARAEIESDDAKTGVELNEHCEFSLPPLPQGVYTLRLRLPNIELEIPRLELKD